MSVLHCRACGLPDPEDKCCSIRASCWLLPCPCCLYYIGNGNREHHPACPVVDPDMTPRSVRDATYQAAFVTGPTVAVQ